MPIQQAKIEQISNLEFLAKQVVEGFITGLHKSPFHGFSVEFAEHRIYNKGESTRHIDWKLFGRTEKFFIKRYEEETNLRCQIIIDDSSSMLFPEISTKDKSEKLNKLGFSANAAAALILLLKKQSDAVGLSVFSESLELQTPAKSNLAHQKFLFSELEKLVDASYQTPKKTFAVEALHTIAESIHKRSLVIIFSDMMDSNHDKEDLFSALQHLKHNKHEVVLFHVVDKEKEVDFNFDNRPYRFIDSETNEEVKLNPNDVKESYKKSIADYKHELKLRCGAFKIDFVEADINEGFNNVLLTYLIKRAAML